MVGRVVCHRPDPSKGGSGLFLWYTADMDQPLPSRPKRVRYHIPFALFLTLRVGDDVLDRWGRVATVADIGPTGVTLLGEASRRSWTSREPWTWVYEAAPEFALVA
jgi:hypothetical protein